MRLTIALLSILFLTTPAFADRHAREVCTAAAEDAVQIMESRQNAVPKMLLMSYNKGNKVAEYMITRAYQEPRRSTHKERQRAIKSFEDKMRKECYVANR